MGREKKNEEQRTDAGSGRTGKQRKKPATKTDDGTAKVYRYSSYCMYVLTGTITYIPVPVYTVPDNIIPTVKGRTWY